MKRVGYIVDESTQSSANDATKILVGRFFDALVTQDGKVLNEVLIDSAMMETFFSRRPLSKKEYIELVTNKTNARFLKHVRYIAASMEGVGGRIVTGLIEGSVREDDPPAYHRTYRLHLKIVGTEMRITRGEYT